MDAFNWIYVKHTYQNQDNEIYSENYRTLQRKLLNLFNIKELHSGILYTPMLF